MSITDPEAEPVQPDEGQGGEGTSNAPYQEYLDRIPEELRADVEPVFRDWDGQVTKRFQEASEFRKQWEPLADTGIAQYPKDEVAWMVSMRQAVEDPETMKQWIDGYAKEHNLTFGEATAAVQDQIDNPTLDEFGYQDPSQQFEKLLEQKLGPLQSRLEEYGSRFQQQEQQQAEAEALRLIESQVAGLEEKHGKFDEQTKELVNTLAGRYIESDPMNAIPRAFEDLQRWRNDVEKSALQAKVDSPSPAETGGVPDVSPVQHSRIDSQGVKDAALEMVRNQNRANSGL